MNSVTRCIALATLALSTLVPAHAQTTTGSSTTLQAVLSNQNIPLTLQMKDLTSEYRRIAVGSQPNDVMNMKMRMFGRAAGVEVGTFYTKGETLDIGGESYLVAYAPDTPFDMNRMRNWDGHGPLPRVPKPVPETKLTLSLLHLRSAGSLNDVRPFNREEDMEWPEQTHAASVRTLEQLGQGMLRYLRASNDVLPRLDNPIQPHMARRVYPHIGDRRLFLHPTTEEPYLFNTILAGKKVQHVGPRQSMVMFYEGQPASDGRRAVLFLDGHVERVTPQHWARLRQASKIEEFDEDEDEWAMAPDTIIVQPPRDAVVIE